MSYEYPAGPRFSLAVVQATRALQCVVRISHLTSWGASLCIYLGTSPHHPDVSSLPQPPHPVTIHGRLTVPVECSILCCACGLGPVIISTASGKSPGLASQSLHALCTPVAGRNVEDILW